MNFIKSFFEERGFDFEQSLKSANDSIEKNEKLSNRLIDNIFIYSSSSQTRTSFYVLTTELNSEELNDFRTFVWNENKVDLFFVLDKSNSSELFPNFKFELIYAKSSPKLSLLQSRVDYFSNNEKDLKKLDRISKWQFDSGTFWLNYYGFLDKIKKTKSIDKELIFTLEKLKTNLFERVNNDEIVQALIDRTLYIKYLEDNHIINSAFYDHYFNDKNLTFKLLLEKEDVDNINLLFKIINEIFNNYLFETPEINTELLKKVCDLICLSISGNLNRSQLRLFDFQFNVLPVEFISYIYEVFLEKKQKENGIYYTPKKLAQLIVDDVIPENSIGKILDPACGSGMFLVVAFQKLIENSDFVSNSIEEKIQFRIKLLSENIFGIEKQSVAQRFTIFSLSLQIFKNILPEEIKIYIADKLKKEQKIQLFRTHSFFENIICANSLNIESKPFEGKKFDYIVGNPPFFEIKGNSDEIAFINSTFLIDGNTFKVKDIVEDNQISQCFLLKINDWGNENTRFGFVVNSSNFFDGIMKFEKYFFKNFKVEKIYELSDVKDVLFENASEGVSALIFNNNISFTNNLIKYYPVKLSLFSQKPFNLLVIDENKTFTISQNDIVNDKIRLRDYLLGNELDIKLVNKINANSNEISDEILRYKNNKPYIHTGLQIAGVDVALKEFKITREEYNKDNQRYLNLFREKYTSKIRDKRFNIPFICSNDINPFVIVSPSKYIENTEKFRRKGKSDEVFEGKKIILTRIGNNIKAILTEEKIYFEIDIYTFKLQNESLYNIVVALLNSIFLNYFINLNLRKRMHSSFSRIGVDEILKIPIPKDLNQDLVAEISEISKNLSDGKYNYEGKIKEKLNNLIFDLYNLSYLEKQRIKDYSISKKIVEKSELEVYKEALKDTIEIYFNDVIDIQYSENIFNLIVIKINIGSNIDNPLPKKTAQFILNEIFKQNSSENFLASQEKIFGKDCIYIIKKNENINWTETKAYEDGQEILKRLN